MDVAAITGVRQCRIVDLPQPRVAAEFALLKVQVAPMCTEFQNYRDGHVTDRLGHEAAGEVVEAPAGSRVRAGDRVVAMPLFGCGHCALCISGDHVHCRQKVDPHEVCGSPTGEATYAQFCLKQDWLLWPIPEDLSYEEGSMACCGLGPTFNAMQRMQVNALDTVLISGLGPVGLGGAINALTRGARVLALDSNPYRAALARDLGVETVLDPLAEDCLPQILDLTGGLGADKALEASSAETAPGLLVEATRSRGQMASVGWGGPLLARRIVYKGLTVHGVWHWNHVRDTDAMLTTIRRARPLLRRFVTHHFPLREVQAAWDLQLTGQCGKILLHPW